MKSKSTFTLFQTQYSYLWITLELFSLLLNKHSSLQFFFKKVTFSQISSLKKSILYLSRLLLSWAPSWTSQLINWFLSSWSHFSVLDDTRTTTFTVCQTDEKSYLTDPSLTHRVWHTDEGGLNFRPQSNGLFMEWRDLQLRTLLGSSPSLLFLSPS